MKSIKLYLGLLLSVMAVGFVSCTDDFDVPEVVVPQAEYNEADVISIEAMKTQYWQDGDSYITEIKDSGKYIKGRVVSSDESGNIYKSICIQDGTAAIAFSVNQNSLYNQYRVGQEVVVALDGMHVGKYRGYMQFGDPQDFNGQMQATFMSFEKFQAHVQKNGFPDRTAVDTLDINISDLPTEPLKMGLMQSRIVRFKNVHWETPGEVYAPDKENASRNLIDETGASIVVRNSGYAKFHAERIPNGTGDVIGILGFYGSSWQLLLNSVADVRGFIPFSTEGEKEDPYTVDRAIELQGKTSGWVKGYIVGAVAPGVTTVKSNADIEWKDGTVLDNTVVIAADKNTKDFTKCIVVSLPAGSDIQLAANLAEGYKAYQKELLVNGSFENMLGAAGLVTSGSLQNFELEGYTPPAALGTEENPYVVEQVLDGSAKGIQWVKGYIVGWIKGMSISSGANFNAPATTDGNILVAETAGETDYNYCIAIQLPAGAVRAALNLKDNPANLGKAVKLKGSIEKYFGVPGMKNLTDGKIAE